LEKQFSNQSPLHKKQQTPFIPLLAVEYMRSETEFLFNQVRQFDRGILCKGNPNDDTILNNIKSLAETSFDSSIHYQELKQQEGYLLGYFSHSRKYQFNEQDTRFFLQCAQATRLCIYSAKACRDVEHNMQELETSISNTYYRHREIISQEWDHFDKDLDNLLALPVLAGVLEGEVDARIENERFLYEEKVAEIINQMNLGHLSSLESATLLNVYREILSAKKSLLRAIRHFRSYPSEEQKVENNAEETAL
jgi:hypothetical protein